MCSNLSVKDVFLPHRNCSSANCAKTFFLISVLFHTYETVSAVCKQTATTKIMSILPFQFCLTWLSYPLDREQVLKCPWRLGCMKKEEEKGLNIFFFFFSKKF